jgi:hypothetical protein
LVYNLKIFQECDIIIIIISISIIIIYYFFIYLDTNESNFHCKRKEYNQSTTDFNRGESRAKTL